MTSIKTYHTTSDVSYSVLVSSAKMPGTCRGRYSHVAVLEHDRAYTPSCISDRPRGVRRIKARWSRVFDGRTDRCARAIAETSAIDLAIRLANGVDRQLNDERTAGYAASLAARDDEI